MTKKRVEAQSVLQLGITEQEDCQQADTMLEKQLDPLRVAVSVIDQRHASTV